MHKKNLKSKNVTALQTRYSQIQNTLATITKKATKYDFILSGPVPISLAPLNLKTIISSYSKVSFSQYELALNPCHLTYFSRLIFGEILMYVNIQCSPIL